MAHVHAPLSTLPLKLIGNYGSSMYLSEAFEFSAFCLSLHCLGLTLNNLKTHEESPESRPCGCGLRGLH